MVRGDDPQIDATLAVLKAADADIVALQGIDWDAEGKALGWLANQAGYAHHYTQVPNAGLATPLDLDGDGQTGGPGDAQGWGRFHGDGALALLSRFPIHADAAVNASDLLWRDLPDARLPQINDTPFPSAEALSIQRLSSTGHWMVPIALPGDHRITILTFHASPPVFDGPEDRNGLRNADEVLLWHHLLNGQLPITPPTGPIVVMGNANLDPQDGEGRHEAIQTLLAHPRLTPLAPVGAEATDTVDWQDPTPGNLRVSYILPDRALNVADHGVFWPAPTDARFDAIAQASRHRLLWVDLSLP